MAKMKSTIKHEVYDEDYDYKKVDKEVEKIVETQQSYISNINDLLNNE